MEDLREYEKKMQEETNKKVGACELPESDPASPTTPTNTPTESSPPALPATDDGNGAAS